MVAKPGQIGGRVSDAVRSEKGLQFLRGEGLFEEAKAVERGKTRFGNLCQDGLDEQTSPPVLTLGREFAVHRLHCFAKVVEQRAGAIGPSSHIAAEELECLRVASEVEQHLMPGVLLEAS
jgi:hypothetical protein